MNPTAANKLVLGTVQLGMQYGINNNAGQPSNEEALEILHYAQQHGINILDTADAYGSAMERIGEYHARQSSLPETSAANFRIITKFHADSETHLPSKAAQAITKLNVSSLYCYQYHRFSDVLAFPHLQTQLLDLKVQGMIERIGVSVYTNDEILLAAASPLIDVIQLPFNLLDNMRLRGDALRQAKNAGKEIHTRSVFLQGLFFKNITEIPPKLRPLAPHIQYLQKLQENGNLGSLKQNVQHNEHQANTPFSLQAIALNYALHNPYIDAVLVGVETRLQLSQILDSAQSEWNAAFEQEIESIIVEDPSLLNPVNWSA